jgi:hypothetical protein
MDTFRVRGGCRVATGIQAEGVLLVIYVSVLFAVVINPTVEQMQRLRIGKWSSAGAKSP